MTTWQIARAYGNDDVVRDDDVDVVVDVEERRSLEARDIAILLAGVGTSSCPVAYFTNSMGH